MILLKSIFELIVSNHQNENPYLLLDSILPVLGKSNYNTYSYTKKKTSKYLY